MISRILPETLAATVRRLPRLRGRTRLAERSYERWKDRRSGSWQISMRRGHELHLPKASYQSWKPAFTREYDEAEIDVITARAVAGTSVLDIGACFGLYTVPLALAGRQQGFRVTAFEPVEANLTTLIANLQRNGLDDEVRVEALALGSARGSVEMSTEPGGAGNAAVASSTIEPHQYLDLRAGTVRTEAAVLPLDDVTDLRPCSVIKMDVEGFELEVLRGAMDSIAADRPTIIGEFSPTWLDARAVPFTDVMAWATSAGYQIGELQRRRVSRASDRHRCVEVPLSDPADRTTANLILTPRR